MQWGGKGPFNQTRLKGICHKNLKAIVSLEIDFACKTGNFLYETGVDKTGSFLSLSVVFICVASERKIDFGRGRSLYL